MHTETRRGAAPRAIAVVILLLVSLGGAAAQTSAAPEPEPLPLPDPSQAPEAGPLPGAAPAVSPEPAALPTSRYNIEFSGLSEVARSSLERAARRELEAFATQTGSAADIADAAYAMELALRDQGYAQAVVRFRFFRETAPDGNDAVRRVYLTNARNWRTATGVQFTVEEGRKYRLGEIGFTGAQAYDPEYLREFFQLPQEGLFGSGPEIFVEDAVDSGVTGIEELYLLDGYYDVAIEPLPPVYSRDGTADVTIAVTEGPRYTLEDQTIGSEDLNEDQIRVLSRSLPAQGQPYYTRLAAEAATVLRNTLGNWGFQAEVRYDVRMERLTPERGSVSVTYTVEAGKPLMFLDYRIINEGDRPLRTREFLITSRFPFEPGDTIDRGRLNLGLSRLYSLGIFRAIEVEVIPTVESEGPLQPAVIEIRLREDDSRFVEAAAGWGTWELLRGSIRYTDLNLFGTGRAWTLDASASIRGYAVGLNIQDRVLFGPASLLSANVRYRYAAEPSFTVTEGNASLLFGYSIGTWWNFEASYTYSLSRAVSTGTVPETEDELFTTGRVGVQGSFDTRNSALLPSTGVHLGAGVSLSSRLLGSERDFLQYSFRGETYLGLFGFGVLALTARYETKQILDSGGTLPIQERYFLGGGDSIRSFGRNTLSPVGPEGEAEGGLTAARATVELRFPVWRELHLALFSDLGVVSPSTFSLDGAFGTAFGAGLRYYLPVGPIRLDAAYNPGELHADTNRWELVFAVGFNF